MRRRSLLGLFLVAACGPGPLRHPERMTVWAETLPADRVTARVTFAGQHKLNLNVSLVDGKTDRAYLQAICQAADAGDVALRFWPGLSDDEGYWANQANVDHFLGFVDQLLDEGHDVCPRLDGVVIDMEMPIHRVAMLTSLRAQGKTDIEIARWLVAGIDATAFERARGLYNDAARRVHARGYSFSVTTLPMNAEDYVDLDETIAQALWTPIEGIEWDAVSFQVYRNLIGQQFPSPSGSPYTSGLVASYARTVVGKWGARAGFDLGTTGGGVGVTVGLASADELQADIAAALAEGIDPGHVAIFSLEGLDGKDDAAAWVAVPAARAATPTFADLQFRATFRALDLLPH